MPLMILEMLVFRSLGNVVFGVIFFYCVLNSAYYFIVYKKQMKTMFIFLIYISLCLCVCVFRCYLQRDHRIPAIISCVQIRIVA